MLQGMKFVACLGLVALAAALPAADRRRVGEAGKFDYYLLSMSWSPGYCATHGGAADNAQCGPGRHFAFVLHGLWPQYKQPQQGRDWPEYCSEEPGLRNPASMLDIMPSPTLIRHEWERHGTCSGLSADAYFALGRKALGSVKAPPALQSPKSYQTMSPAAVKQQFLKANPALRPEGLAIQCSSNYLSEVRVCVDRNLSPVPCTGQKECKAPSLRIPPVR